MSDTWTAITGYATADYADTMVFKVDQGTKKLEKISGQTLVAGEENSQYIRFEMPRYWDGIDIIGKTIKVVHMLANRYFGETATINGKYSDDMLQFGWVVPKTACCISGTLMFVIVVTGTDYVLKTQIAETPVAKSIDIDGTIPEPSKEAWYREFQARIDSVLQNAEDVAARAAEAAYLARSYVGAPLAANHVADMVDPERIYVYTGSEDGYTAGYWYHYDGSQTPPWVPGGIYNAVAVETDTTLRVAGKAADGKATGDAVAELKEDLSAVGNGVLTADNFTAALERGKYWNYDTGVEGNSTRYIRTKSKEIAANGTRNAVELISDTYKFSVQCFDSAKTFLYSLPYTSGIAYLPKAVYYFGISIRRADIAIMEDADLTAVLGLLRYYKAADNTMTKTDASADANAVGQLFTFADKVTPIPITEGCYLAPSNGKLVVDAPLISTLGWSYGFVECSPNDKFCVNGESYNGEYPLAWYFLDDEYNIIISATQNITVSNKVLTAPADAAYFVVHTKNPKTLSFKGASAAQTITNVSDDLALYKQGKEPFELGLVNDTTGYNGVEPNPKRVRSANYLSLDAYNYFAYIDEILALYIYAYDASKNYLGTAGSRNKKEWYASEIVAEFSSAKYIKAVIKDGYHETDISSRLAEIQGKFVCKKITGGSYNTAPELSAEQKAAIKSLADDYYTNRGRFNYLSSATINDYASASSVKYSNKYKICCSLLAGLLWMGRDAADFPTLDGEDTYSNAVTKAFDFGYYFQFADRALYGLHPNDGYYGFYNQFGDADYAGSYSWNSYYQAGANTQYHQRYNPFLYANDMAKEMDRLGYSIPMSELQTGDLIFTQYPTFDPKKDTFDAIAYKHINHVAIVYEKTDSGIVVIESTPRFTDAIHKSSSAGTDEEKVRIGYLLNTAVCFARHPAAWGNGGNVPQSIETR